MNKKKLNIVAIIPARGGSKRLSRKNIKLVNNKPMISYAINACKNSNYNIDCYVSTEDKEIEDISKNFGAKVYIRPKKLADDLTFKQDVIVDAITNIFKNNYNEYLNLTHMTCVRVRLYVQNP